MLDRLLEWDRNTFIYLNNLGVEKYDAFWSTVTKYPPWIPLFLLFVYLIASAYHWKQTIYIIVTLGVMVLFVDTLTEFTKSFVGRLRPNNDEEINTLIRILRNPTGFSFFSGHSATSFSITAFVVLILRPVYKWAYLFFIWPLLFALSRIYLGVHFPIDLIVGALVGMLSAWIFHRLYLRLILPYLTSGHHE